MGNETLVEIVRTHPGYQEYHSPEFDRVLEAMLRVDRKDFLPEKAPVEVTVSYLIFSQMIQAYNVLVSKDETDDIKGKAFAAMLSLIKMLADSSIIVIAQPRDSAYDDNPLKIGYGQTCSQPSLVAFMAYWLELKEGMKVLEVGTGCGYSAAITCHLIAPSGRLVTAEIIPELEELGRSNLEAHFGKEGLERRLKVISGDGSIGLETDAPFDRIYLAAGVDESFDPFKLVRYLNPERGILLFPEQKGDLIKQIYEKGNLIDAKRYGDGKIEFVPLLRINTR